MRPYWRRDRKDIRGLRTYIKRRWAGLREVQGSPGGNRASPIGASRSFEMVYDRRSVALDAIFSSRPPGGSRAQEYDDRGEHIERMRQPQCETNDAHELIT